MVWYIDWSTALFLPSANFINVYCTSGFYTVTEHDAKLHDKSETFQRHANFSHAWGQANVNEATPGS